MTAFRETLSNRQDGYWEFLATAVGKPESILRTEEGLSASALARGSEGPAIAPSIVSARVEALAAFDPDKLAKIAAEWRHPQQIGDDPWWLSAWSTSLRHLRAVGAVGDEEFRCEGLSNEMAVLSPQPSDEQIIWRDFAQQLQYSSIYYDACRRAANLRVAETNISADDLERAPWEMLRLLRGRTWLLDASALEFLIDRARRWATLDPLEVALIAEFCNEISPDANSRLRADVAAIVPTTSDPRDLIPFSYVLLGAWHAP
jgi:hypothetical protein